MKFLGLALVAGVLAVPTPTPLLAAAQQQRTGGGTSRPVATLDVLFAERITALEGDIGRLMQRRVDDSAGVPNALELRIDVRIVARWMLARAAKAEAGSEMQASAWIRANDLIAAAAVAEKDLDAGRRGPGADAPALKALRDLTFKLGEPKSVADLDAASRTAGLALLTAMGGEANAARLPTMRPLGQFSDQAGPGGTGPRTLEQLAARARELAVSVPLRAQLLAVSQAAGQVAQDPKRHGELPEMREVLEEAVTLAEGFQSNAAVEREDRVRMESQVAQGLAMFLDARTRGLGRERVASLGQYRQMLARLREMKLPPDLLKRFASAFTWAQRNPEAGGGQVMGAIDLFVRQDARLASPPPAGEPTGLAAKAAGVAKQRVVAAREAFLGASVSSFSKPEVLRRAADAFRDEIDALHAITRAPEALKVVNGYRPKPFGGIDKRVQAALQTWTNDAPEAERRTAMQFLTRLARLADYANELAAPAAAASGDNDKDETRRRYTNGLTEQFNARRKATVGEIVNAAAAGQPLDDMALAPLERMAGLLAAVRSAVKAEQAVVQAEALARWVDWGADAPTLEAVLGPYRSATADAFEGFARGGAAPYQQWETTHRRYQPTLALLERISAYADDCGGLPPGRTGALAKLTTPLAGQPFRDERLARLMLDAVVHFRRAENAASADATLDALAARLMR